MATSPRTYERGPWEKQDADLEAACVQAPAGEAEAVQRVLESIAALESGKSQRQSVR